MVASAQAVQVDFYGHHTLYNVLSSSGYPALISAPSGTVAGTVVNPGTADPTGTQSGFIGNDMYGQFTITTAGTQTTGALRNIYFANPIPALRPVVVSIYSGAGAQVGGTITVTLTTTSLQIAIGTGLTTATPYTVTWAIL